MINAKSGVYLVVWGDADVKGPFYEQSARKESQTAVETRCVKAYVVKVITVFIRTLETDEPEEVSGGTR